jgi:hypothetical protein
MRLIPFLFKVTEKSIPLDTPEREQLKLDMEAEYTKLTTGSKLGQTVHKVLANAWFRFALMCLYLPVANWLYRLSHPSEELTGYDDDPNFD